MDVYALGVRRDPVYADHKYLYRFSIANGTPIGDPIDVNALIGEQDTYVPSSAISIAGTESNPVLLVAATRFVRVLNFDIPVSTYVLAIDLVATNGPKLLWKVATPYTTGQYPITADETTEELIFATTFGRGVRVIGKVQQ